MYSVIISLLLSASAFAIPSNPPNACYEDCTPYMSELLNEFETIGVAPDLSPAVYSGECYHLGQYSPERAHHAVVMLDQVNQQPNFSTIFSFFAETNEFSDWTVDIARKEMSEYWKTHGDVRTEDNTSRAEVLYDDGAPAYIYWMRQNPINKQLLYITYAGIYMKSFCRLDLNKSSVK